jgi:hypothetical protein
MIELLTIGVSFRATCETCGESHLLHVEDDCDDHSTAMGCAEWLIDDLGWHSGECPRCANIPKTTRPEDEERP